MKYEYFLVVMAIMMKLMMMSAVIWENFFFHNFHSRASLKQNVVISQVIQIVQMHRFVSWLYI